jgi:1,4-alpha-glucan branching enzyme
MARTKQKNKTDKKRITFKLEAAEAKQAVLVGDFNSWNEKKHVMKKDNKGRWTKIVTLPPGRYEYKFLVDGRWQNDPGNDQIVQNTYGTHNNIVKV